MPHRLFWIMAVCFALRLPALAWPVVSDDEAIYDTMAQVVRQGGVMYRDVVDHKPPGLVYTYAALQTSGTAGVAALQGTHARMVPVHLAGALAAALTAWLLYRITRHLSGSAHAWAAAALYGISTVARCPYDGLAVNGELLMNLPTAAALWCVCTGSTRKRGARTACDVAAGALLAVAGLFKWQALVTGLVFPWLMHAEAYAGAMPFTRHLCTRALGWFAGWVVPLAATACYFASQGVATAAWQWGLLFNLHYIGDGPGVGYALMRLGFQALGVMLPAAWLYVHAWQGLRAAESRTYPRAVLLWSLLAACCVCIGGRFFGHYFLQLDMPLCVLAAASAGALWERASWRLRSTAWLPALLFVGLSFSPRVTRAVFDPGDPDWPAVGRAVAEMVAPDETLFVWGNAPLVYAYADRRPGTRFVFCNYMTGLSPATPSETDASVTPTSALAESWPMLLTDLERRRPAWILDTAAAPWKGYEKFPIAKYPALAAYVAQHYEPHGTVAGAAMLRRRT